MQFLKALSIVFIPAALGLSFAWRLMQVPLPLASVALAVLFLLYLCAGFGHVCGLPPRAFWRGPPLNFIAMMLLGTGMEIGTGMIAGTAFVLACVISFDIPNKFLEAARLKRAE